MQRSAGVGKVCILAEDYVGLPGTLLLGGMITFFYKGSKWSVVLYGSGQCHGSACIAASKLFRQKIVIAQHKGTNASLSGRLNKIENHLFMLVSNNGEACIPCGSCNLFKLILTGKSYPSLSYERHTISTLSSYIKCLRLILLVPYRLDSASCNNW